MIDLCGACSHLARNTTSRPDTREHIKNSRVAQGKAAVELLLENPCRFTRSELCKENQIEEGTFQPGTKGNLLTFCCEGGRPY